jgi:ubiquinone/menaquinone biosynthesis C-methylase UbiE
MAVSAHLHIKLEEYDQRIRTFVLGYETMVAAVAELVATIDREPLRLVDLGTGTGALALACLALRPTARVTGIDEDEGMLARAAERLRASAVAPTLIRGSFITSALPDADAIVASLALHHIRTAAEKRELYVRCRAALAPGGLFVTADCCPATNPVLRAAQFERWRAHLQVTYSPSESDDFLAAWAKEDVYFSLDEELTMLAGAGFSTEIVWRDGPMAVVAARGE